MSTTTRRRPRARSRHPPRQRLRRASPNGAHFIENAEVARIFREMADVLEIEGANPFRIRAYRNAARTVEELPEPVARMVRDEPKRLTTLPGIGADLAGKIGEIVGTGRLAALREAEHEAPHGAVSLMHVPGIGPRKARILCEQLGVRSIAGLERAARGGRIAKLRGFGKRTEERILRELKAHAAEETRVRRAVAAQYGESLLDWMRGCEFVARAEIAGSYRRCRETVGDLDLLVTAEGKGGSASAIERFVEFPEVRDVIARGRTRAAIRLRSGLNVDLRVLPERSWGAALHYFTGSKSHNIAVRRIGHERGLKINEYGIFRGTRRIGGAEEREVFAAVGLPWIPPELREDRGEIDAARAHHLPHLLTLEQVRGDLQSHTTDSDGRDTLDAMAEAAESLGYKYLAVTDHTPSVRIAGGLNRAGFRRQMRRIDRLNARLRSLTVLKGVEVDIFPDGSLDLDDETLAAFDIVVASMHAKLQLPEAAQTARIVRALQHPSVDVLGHPTGRLIGRRRPASFDLEAVCRAAADHGVMLEINAQPERLDRADIAARAAVGHGVALTLGTDAHAVVELGFMRWGVDQARRGWVEARHVANTRPLPQLLKLLHGHRA
ncbi:MAG TPA: DNA polymerase/3'-5' exonuclease PolX [Gemmatimonadaceae bacterium]|nr:DNA polymerase/3'-5' exonuclease PolX [Gemmatimonadaceae bacterium]